MESNRYEHQLFQAIEGLTVIANQAYWKERKDCGSDFHEPDCQDCQHYPVCQAWQKLKHALYVLREWNC